MYEITNTIDSTAKAYYLAYRTLIKSHIDLCNFSNDTFSVYVFPAITSAVFSCEIALKNLIFLETGKEVRGHDLSRLFKQLSSDKQRNYMDITIKLYNRCSKFQKHNANINANIFNEKLVMCSNNFVEFRYLYEGGKKTDLDFLEAFMFAVNDLQNEYEDFICTYRR